MKRFLSFLLILSMLTMAVGTSLAEEAASGATVVIKDAVGETLYEGAFEPSLLDQYPEAASFEVKGDVDEHLWIGNDNAKLIVNGKLLQGLSAYGDDLSVTVTGGVTAQGDDAIYAGEKSNVTVDGDVTGIATPDSWGNGIYANDEATVAVDGNVSAGGGDSISVTDQAAVTVSGDVTGEYDGVYSYTNGHYDEEKDDYVYDEPTTATVNVDGNVTGKNNGVSVHGDSTVTVGGNVTATNYSGIQATNEIEWVYDEETGESKRETHTVNSSDIQVDGNVTGGRTGIQAGGEAAVTVGGDVTAKGHESTWYDAEGNEGTFIECTGISASDDTTVTVGGNVTAVAEQKDEEGNTRQTGEGILAHDNATVKVDGNVTGGESGIRIEKTWVDGEETGTPKATVTVGGNVESDGTAVYARGEGTVNIGGDVTSNGQEYTWTDEEGKEHTQVYGDGIEATEKAQVTVGGDVTAVGTGISVFNTEEWTVDPETGEEIYQGEDVTTAVVTVGGNVTGGETGIYADGKAVVAVGGNVTGKDTGIGLWDSDATPTVIVEGDVSAEERQAIYMGNNDSTVKVWGDVTGGTFASEEDEETEKEDPRTDWEKKYDEAREEAEDKAFEEQFGQYKDMFSEENEWTPGAIDIRCEDEEAKGELIVGGTVTAQGDSVPIVIDWAINADDFNGELPDIEKVLPDMKVYEVAPTSDGEYFQVNAWLYKEDVDITFKDPDGNEVKETTSFGTDIIGGDAQKEAVETLAKTIQYIIKVINPENGEINLDGVTYDAENDLMLAREDDKIAVHVKSGKGYKVTGVDAGKIAELIDNGDGTWTVIVKRGGGVTISATLTKVSSGKGHRAIGQTILFGHYDLDGDGTAEELSWLCTRVMGGYAKLVLIAGVDQIPDDFMTAFTEEEAEGIQNGEVTQLGEKEVAKRFNDNKVHPVINVKLEKLGF